MGPQSGERAAWFYADGGKAIGPLTRAELLARLPSLQSGRTLVFGPGMKEWAEADQAPDLQPQGARHAPAAWSDPGVAPARAAGVAPGATAVAAAAPGPWALDLLFRPSVFFRRHLDATSTWVIAVAIVLVGVGAAIDRLETQMITGTNELVQRIDSWAGFWTWAGAMGLLGGFIGLYAIGGWWYGVRLRWSGATLSDEYRHRRVYILSALVAAVPTLLLAVFETIRYETPRAALEAAEFSWLSLSLVILPFWACWISYCGARAAFDADRTPALIWFLVLPVAIVVIALGLLAGLAFVSVLTAPPEISRPLVHDADGLRFEYPGNWTVDRDEFGNEGVSLTVSMPQDGFLVLERYASDESIERELDGTATLLRDEFDELSRGDVFKRWGAFDGLGRKHQAKLAGAPAVVRVFLKPVAGGYLEVRLVCSEADLETAQPGLDLIERTLQITSE